MTDLSSLRRTLVVILAGGQGERLYPLTKDRSKPAVPFGGSYRIIDFTLSNCINSGLRRIFVFTQYKSYSLDKHLQRGWNVFNYEAGEFLYRIPPQLRIGQKWYEGTADAVYHNIYLLERNRPRRVLILSGDHIYKMDYGPMFNFHVEQGTPLTLAAAVVPRSGADQFGILEVDSNFRVVGFEEKPSNPRTIPGDPEHCLVNMGVYLFETDDLVRSVSNDARDPHSNHDFGKDIIPELVATGGVSAYPFRDAEGQPAYWRDIGTLDSFFDASMDLVSRQPQFDLYDRDWPIRAWQPPVPPAKSVHGFQEDEEGLAGVVSNSIIGGGSIVSGGKVIDSILSSRVRVNSCCEVNDSILMDDVEIGRYAAVRNAIIDKGVTIPERMQVGFNHEKDRELFKVTDGGLVVVPRGLNLSE